MIPESSDGLWPGNNPPRFGQQAVAIYSIGDLAIEQTVTAVARLEKRSPETRIEHCQFISKQSAIIPRRIRRLAESG
ncbi:MAG TPA: hypothetical protein VHN12_11175 [Geobacteraceae bacterium]|nr:hypothetical protein [Geobacteraceae bacterium]